MGAGTGTGITTRNVIFDGYTRDGYVAPLERQHEGCAFKFRPMLLEQNEQVTSQVEKADSVKAAHIIAAAVSKHLVSWSESDKDGQPLPITFENVRRLHPVLLNKMRGIIGGYYPSDLPQNAGEEEQNDYVAGLLAETSAAGLTSLVEQQKN